MQCNFLALFHVFFFLPNDVTTPRNSQQLSHNDFNVMLSRFSFVLLFVALWTIVCQGPLSMGFSRQEYWSGLLFLSPGDLPNPGIKSISPLSPALTGVFFTTSATWEAPKILSRGTQYFFSLCSFWLANSASRQEGDQGIAYNLDSFKFQNLLNKSLTTMIIGFLFLVSFHCKTSLQGVQKV